MPALKITKDISSQLFKFVKRVDIKINPFDNRTRSARELMSQMKSERLSRANPKMNVNINIVGTADPPLVEFEFIDGSKKEFDSQGFLANEMLDEVYLFANSLDIEYELEGKTIDN
eukprot:457047_1